MSTESTAAIALEQNLGQLSLCRYVAERCLLPMAATEGMAHIIRYANPAFCRLADREERDMIGHPFAELLPKGKMNQGVSLLDHVYYTGESGAAVDRVHHATEGKTVYWSYAAWALFDEEQRPAGVMIQVTDQTEATLARQGVEKTNEEIREVNQELLLSGVRVQKLADAAVEAEQMLLQAQKMDGIGRLAGGISHDFNNILTVILGYAEIAEKKLPSGDIVQNYLHTIKKAAERAATLTSQLLAFSRKQIIEPQVIDLNALIIDEDKMLRRLIGEDIELAFAPKQEGGQVVIDPGQFEQVLLNLMVNARDAMPEGGKITIETANVMLDEEHTLLPDDVTPGEYVLLAVSDTGTGMTKDVQAHLFEPFFTTKEPGKGTGLGLASCYGIVTQSGGHIQAHSELGEGTTFNIYLPRVEVTALVTKHEEPLDFLGGPEVVLIVEDEPMVRGIGVATLRLRGYAVLEADNGMDALRLIHEYPGKIDLVVTDIVMPLMGGRELADNIRKTDPNIRVLFTSGYTDDAIVSQRLVDPGFAFLQKPFTPADLTRKVREVLDGAGKACVQ